MEPFVVLLNVTPHCLHMLTCKVLVVNGSNKHWKIPLTLIWTKIGSILINPILLNY